MWVWPFHVHGYMAASGSSHEGYQVHLTESTMDTSSSISSSSTNWSLCIFCQKSRDERLIMYMSS